MITNPVTLLHNHERVLLLEGLITDVVFRRHRDRVLAGADVVLQSDSHRRRDVGLGIERLRPLRRRLWLRPQYLT